MSGDFKTPSQVTFAPLDPPSRLLMGPGPSLTPPRVLGALAAPTIGHLDPRFLELMDEIQVMLRRVFGTANALTFPVSGTGSAGMEACMANVLEAGDRVVVAKNGIFGGRMADIAERLGCSVALVESDFGEGIDPEAVATALAASDTKLLAFVHAETSTGVLQEVAPLAKLAREAGALCLVDCVTSLGGIPVELDAWGVDLAYAGTQKCLSCPPGLAPVSFSERAVEVLKTRRSKVASWYLDASMLLNYWGGKRAYHHTAPINMLYALRESLIVVLEEGLSAVHGRHMKSHRALVAGLEAMGLSLPVAPALRMPQLNVVTIPEGVEDAAVRGALLRDYDIEIGGGLGPLAGKVWRIGLMGHTARAKNVSALLAALETTLGGLGANIQRGAALPAAHAALAD
ncbi:MAG: alanine--glyoxylate aminotransferase family protein [Myxococcales bacterium]|nr:alanine--glyoxylate aminotransferase family protein [Myxococcales bacterium]